MLMKKVIAQRSQFSNTYILKKNILTSGTPPSIYRGCSTQKKFWEREFKHGDFKPLNMETCVCCNFRTHIDTKNGEKYITLDIYLDKMKITSSDPKYCLGRSGKGFITCLSLNNIVSSHKKERYSITTVIMRYLILRGFLIWVMCRRGPNMNPPTVTFISKYSLLSVRRELIP